MSSLKQTVANRLNAQKSTGPKTEEGKAIVAKNAIKHGLLSKEVILPGENALALSELRESLTEALAPDGRLEQILAERIVSLAWRLSRAERIEVGIFAFRKYTTLLKAALSKRNSCVEVTSAGELKPLFPARIEITDEAKHKQAEREVVEVTALLDADTPSLGSVFCEEAETVTKLHRYETGLERSMFNSLHELQRLQAKRRGNDIPLPMAIDVHMDAGS